MIVINPQGMLFFIFRFNEFNAAELLLVQYGKYRNPPLSAKFHWTRGTFSANAPEINGIMLKDVTEAKN